MSAASPRSAPRIPRSAILLLGPTGSGKTPLGEELERHGLRGRRCAHFDFGASLRAVARAPRRPPGLSARDMEVIRRSLQTGSLLEDEHFPIARKLLRAFLKRRRVRADDWIVLNGLPRHAGQASALERLLAVKAVVRLNCSARTVRRRIATDAGGDRTGRADDLPREVARRLRLFRRRTVPLLDYYASRKIHILQLRVGVDASAEDLRQRLQTLIRA